MKGPALATLVLVPLLASACATAGAPPSMPAWAPGDVALVVASAPGTAAPDEVRIPRSADDGDEIRIPSADDQEVRVPRDADRVGKMRVPRTDEERKTWPASGLYVGGAIITSQAMGDFGDDFALAGPTDLILVPDTDVGAGAGGYISYRWHMNELMVQYSIVEADGDFGGSPADHDTTFYDLDLNWRHYFLEQSPLQPYGLLGIGWSSADVENGSVDQATLTNFEDAELQSGINFNVGVGMAMYTLPWVSFWGQAMYRFRRYTQSSGIDGNTENDPNIDGDEWNLSFGASLCLLPGRD